MFLFDHHRNGHGIQQQIQKSRVLVMMITVFKDCFERSASPFLLVSQMKRMHNGFEL